MITFYTQEVSRSGQLYVYSPCTPDRPLLAFSTGTDIILLDNQQIRYLVQQLSFYLKNEAEPLNVKKWEGELLLPLYSTENLPKETKNARNRNA